MFTDPQGSATAAFEQIVSVAVSVNVDFDSEAAVTSRTLHDFLLSLFWLNTL